MLRVEEIYNFWFPDDQFQKWWFSPEKDDEIRERFSLVHKLATSKELEDLKFTERGCLVLIIILDQFTRNLYRNENYCFNDVYCCEIVNYYFKNYDYLKLNPCEVSFLLLPLRHSRKEEMIKKALTMITIHREKTGYKHVIYNKFVNAGIRELDRLSS